MLFYTMDIFYTYKALYLYIIYNKKNYLNIIFKYILQSKWQNLETVLSQNLKTSYKKTSQKTVSTQSGVILYPSYKSNILFVEMKYVHRVENNINKYMCN